MQKIIADIEGKLNKLTERDRLFVLLIAVLVVLMLWDMMLFTPLGEESVVIKQDIKQTETEIITVQAKIKALQNDMQVDPDLQNTVMLERYQKESKRLDQALAKTTVQVIDPKDIAKMLERILKEQKHLRFVSLKNLEATPEFIETETETDEGEEVGNLNTIYRHSVVIEMEGSYHNTLSYLKKLEQLPWRFFWQGIEIETKKYPNALITLEVYTLGFREGLIGV